MTFIVGEKCQLRVLEENDEEAKIWTSHVMHSQEHMKYVLTGNAPMRWFDIRDEWKEQRKGGAILFGVWQTHKAALVDQQTDEVHHIRVSHTFIGTCGLYEPREIYKSYACRFMIVDPDAIGKGIGLEVANMLTRYAFEKVNAHSLWLGVSAINLRAIKVYLDAGFVVEGKLEDDIFTAGAYWPTYRMGMTREWWEKWQNLKK